MAPASIIRRALHSRWFAHHGFGVLAPDLPGHGRSQGKPLTSINALADWTIALLDAAGTKQAKLIGHSMGSLISLEAAARHPTRVSELCLIATSDAMAVSADLLGAAEKHDHDAIDMVSIWGLLSGRNRRQPGARRVDARRRPAHP